MPFKSEEQRKWMHQNLPDIADRWEKEYEGGGKLEGKLQGPSHEMGGIKFNLGGEIQEAEGGEYVVRKDSVNRETENGGAWGTSRRADMLKVVPEQRSTGRNPNVLYSR